MTGPPRTLSQVLVQSGIVQEQDLASLLAEVTNGRRLGQVVVDRGLVSAEDLVGLVSRHLNMEVVDPQSISVAPAVVQMVPRELAIRHRVVPLAKLIEGDRELLEIATADPFDQEVRQVLASLHPGTSLRFVLSSEEQISSALARCYSMRARSKGSSSVRTGGSAALPDGLMDLHETQVIEEDYRFASYELSDRIGVDTTGDVYLTSQKAPDGRKLVLRRASSSLPKNERAKRRFFGDAERCVGVQHPNVVEVLEVGDRSGHWFVAQEFVEGVQLSKLLAKARKARIRMSERAAIYLMTQVIEGLNHMYRAPGPGGGPLGVLHQELSPDAVVVSNIGEVKVQDFGVQRQTVRSAYSSPEQVSGAELSERTVIFRLGLLWYEVLTGVPLFDEAAGDPSQMEKILFGIGRSLRIHCADLKPEVEAAVIQSLAANPDARFQTLEEMASSLQPLIQGEGAARELSRFVARVQVGKESGSDPVIRPEVVREVGHRVEAIVDKAGGQSMARWLERFGAWFARAPRSHQWATILIPVAIVVGSLVGVAMRSEPSSAQAEETSLESGEEAPKGASQEPEPPVSEVTAPPKESTTSRILPGIQDVPAPEGSRYVAVDGAELRATSDDGGEVLLWLEAGQLVDLVRVKDEPVLVLLPPRGPAGFISSRFLVRDMPLSVLGKEVRKHLRFKACKVTRRRTLDDCLVMGKSQQDRCVDRCRAFAPDVDHSTPPGSRCFQACQAAFGLCADQCRESKAAYETKKRKKRRRRRRR